MSMSKAKKVMFIAPLAILGILVFIAIGGEIVLQLWNWLVPSIFGWREITFWQAVGLLALSRILFGRFGGHSSYRSHIRNRVAERFGRMTPEERERFRQGVRGRCGFGPSAGESTEAGEP
jgi:hypothetical protein